MPELPEVETVRAGIADHSLGRLVQAVRVVDARSLRRHLPGPAHFETALTGRALRGAYRRGKYLWLTLSESDGTLADEALVVHLGMSGQLLVRDEPGGVSGSDSEARAAFDEQPRHLRVALELGPVGATSAAGATRGAASTSRESTGQRLLFVDQRLFGGMFLSPLVPDIPAAVVVNEVAPDEMGQSEVPERFLVPEAVKHIARDPLDEFFDPAAVRRKFLRTSSGIKKVLLDQSVISGVGNIYADEALWRARLHYAKPARTLSAAQTRELLEAVTQVLRESLAAGGTSFDALYVNVLGESGYFERSLNAYGRAGEPCHRCAEAGRTSLMVREPFQNRSSYRCPHCQRAPRSR
ncbi:bifunctional DNA-formamidopyrimidine glycosylase/DNA-(apurinic or apyrimidinic site) lyase [Rothia sp. (in: high G+C Gram-positive bacteria)]|jgi:DNA-formamidopyrimidine glycosylase|uniref:bifunctional DNA-formamidopyrimidine glycosylase/DNA-(apurinic or apyrimidinic site) lyase n=1 Tax=Rothia sp. (in: high G+C Gram-positive bacteria) TaxID=1885016 RepID=UPI001CAE1384|nr:bifunctional DNA-formamidopyrimidine glycosylase/DNA-(apurinic or apyrimidinic site) lyase [Rothia sp. (in: high G+C Gram-positive bacteria)]MBF1668360.1 bifunctional DNA-formamidopyrimidine glycosylase/DNA-(apurinic or apyrimidinic site) lyase [Rothia sp. (in: high G+C Gram-positive bacteria)]